MLGGLGWADPTNWAGLSPKKGWADLGPSGIWANLGPTKSSIFIWARPGPDSRAGPSQSGPQTHQK
jgi:hypothetical protein